jgi:hypothetical protein
VNQGTQEGDLVLKCQARFAQYPGGGRARLRQNRRLVRPGRDSRVQEVVMPAGSSIYCPEWPSSSQVALYGPKWPSIVRRVPFFYPRALHFCDLTGQL